MFFINGAWMANCWLKLLITVNNSWKWLTFIHDGEQGLPQIHRVFGRSHEKALLESPRTFPFLGLGISPMLLIVSKPLIQRLPAPKLSPSIFTSGLVAMLPGLQLDTSSQWCDFRILAEQLRAQQHVSRWWYNLVGDIGWQTVGIVGIFKVAG